ncbi:MAG: hypothetical protein F4Z57_10190 [Gemmatimonadetes bacterium]|nr:hypothetical protein [Gemmatimonadota bacterium]MYC72295.1 hypothetical protein [Gemmatimonadota bacterium]MYI60580.1 hypothetical protein [Gemmatimonadota bacterium]
MSIETVIDVERGCGWRQPGGLYLVAGHYAADCGRLPIPLHVCPTCSQGIKPSRGWTWVDGDALCEQALACTQTQPLCGRCPLGGHVALGRCGLLWIGERYYPTPHELLREATAVGPMGTALGISRRIAAIPKGFVVGQTRVFLAHRKAIQRQTLDEAGRPCYEINKQGEWKPIIEHQAGLFASFVPQAIHYICRGDEADEELSALRDRGITPVRVQRMEQASMWDAPAQAEAVA